MSTYTEKNKRTKASIRASFLDILANRTFDLITVGEISKAANINRGTFYLHYQDKFDLLEQIEQQLFQDLGQHINNLNSTSMKIDLFDKEKVQFALALFSFIQLHAPLLRMLLGNQGRAGFHLRFRDAVTKKVRVNIENNAFYFSQLNVPIDYFLAFITSAFLGLIEQWIQNGLEETPEEITSVYISIISFIRSVQ